MQNVEMAIIPNVYMGMVKMLRGGVPLEFQKTFAPGSVRLYSVLIAPTWQATRKHHHDDAVSRELGDSSWQVASRHALAILFLSRHRRADGPWLWPGAVLVGTVALSGRDTSRCHVDAAGCDR
jgi:hypothetical protein